MEITAVVNRRDELGSTVVYWAKRFEGSNCSSGDEDGSVQLLYQEPLSVVRKLRVDNEDEGGDYATAALSMKRVTF